MTINRIKELEARLAIIDKDRFDVVHELWQLKQKHSHVKSREQRDRRKQRERESIQLFSSVSPGDLVRVRGTKDGRHPWRLVISVNTSDHRPHSIVGFKVGQYHNKWVGSRGLVTENMISKISALRPAADVAMMEIRFK